MNTKIIACTLGGLLLGLLIAAAAFRAGAAAEPAPLNQPPRMPLGKLSIHGRLAQGETANSYRLLMHVPDCQQQPLVEITFDLEHPLSFEQEDIPFRSGTMQVILMKAFDKARQED